MARRPAHKLAHAQCPYGVFNWSDCDAASAHRWGRCKAMVEVKRNEEPRECSNWAISEEGWCGQHYATEQEMAMARARKAEKQLQFEAAFQAFEELKARDPWHWLKALSTSAEATRGLKGVDPKVVAGPRVERGKPAYETGREAAPPRRKPPHRITVRKPPHRLT